MIAAFSGGRKDSSRHGPAAADPLAPLRWSEVTYAARLHRDGTVAEANAALERAAGGPLVGAPAVELVTAAQRPAFARRLAMPDAPPAVFAFPTADGGVEDRRVVVQRHDDAVLLVAEPAVREEGRLVEHVMALNDDLVEARRRLERRTGELEVARTALELANERLRHLESVGAAALAHDDLDGVVGELLPLMRGALHADRAAIWLLDEERDDLVAAVAVGLDGALRPGERAPLGAGMPGAIARDGNPVVVDDVAALQATHPALTAHGGAFAGVPLRAGRRLIGVAHVSLDAPGRFRAEDVALLRLVADRAALAILRVQDLERHRRIGVTLQEMLLPAQLADVPGLAVAARYLPGSADAQVGGDWYDAIVLPSGAVGLAIGDVAGRGLQAAATMGQLRHALRAYAREHASPCAVLQRLDHLTADLGTLATACYAVLDPATGEGTFASAGHLPPLVLESGGAHFLEEALGPPLGVAGKLCAERDFTLPAGAALLLYTDGLVETRGEVIDDGLARLRAAVPRGERDPAALCDQVITALGRAAARDDVALLAARRPA